jgi:hypothetical protein
MPANLVDAINKTVKHLTLFKKDENKDKQKLIIAWVDALIRNLQLPGTLFRRGEVPSRVALSKIGSFAFGKKYLVVFSMRELI